MLVDDMLLCKKSLGLCGSVKYGRAPEDAAAGVRVLGKDLPDNDVYAGILAADYAAAAASEACSHGARLAKGGRSPRMPRAPDPLRR